MLNTHPLPIHTMQPKADHSRTVVRYVEEWQELLGKRNGFLGLMDLCYLHTRARKAARSPFITRAERTHMRNEVAEMEELIRTNIRACYYA